MNASMPRDAAGDKPAKTPEITALDYHALNAMLNLYD